jgi:hypothetical protein
MMVDGGQTVDLRMVEAQIMACNHDLPVHYKARRNDASAQQHNGWLGLAVPYTSWAYGSFRGSLCPPLALRCEPVIMRGVVWCCE